MIDLERVKEKAENIINFYLDSNWEFRFIKHKDTTFSRSLLVTLLQIRSLTVTVSGSYFTTPHNDLTHGISIPSVTKNNSR